MGVYKFLQKLWKNPRRDNPEYRNHLIEWRKGNSIERIEKPTRIDRARSLGYKAKQGVVMARVRITMGGRKRETTHQGRKPGNLGKTKYSTKKNLQTIAEERVSRKFPNLRVVNSYQVGADGKHKWFEIIMIDIGHPQILTDRQLAPIAASNNRGRVQRGLTSAGKKGRGLRNKGKGTEKIRPSIRSNKGLGK